MVVAAHCETKAFSEVRVEATVEVCFFVDFGMCPIVTRPNTRIGSLLPRSPSQSLQWAQFTMSAAVWAVYHSPVPER
jgi:hypothetical protein